MAVFVTWAVATGLGLTADTPRELFPIPVAHRGLFHHAPENTRPAFAACAHLRIGFEVDVRRTSDGHLVCVHDDTLTRTTGRNAAVSELTLAQIQQLDAGVWFDPVFRGEPVPTLDEVLADAHRHSPGSPLIALDVKADDARFARDLVEVVARHHMQPRVVCIGLTISDPDLRKRLAQADPKLPLAVLAQTPAELPIAVKDPHARWVYVRFVPTAAHIASVQAAGKRVFAVGTPFAGREPDNWRAAAKAGADAILTDYPLDLRQTVKSKP